MHFDSFVTSALLMLIMTSLAVALFKNIGLGSVLGLLVAGIAINQIAAVTELEMAKHAEDIRHFTELGVILLLFLIGLKMRPKTLWEMRHEVFGLGLLQIILSGTLIALYLGLYQGFSLLTFVFGLTFALSSTAFVLQLLQEKGDIASKHGNTAFSILLMQDLAIVPLLAVLPLLVSHVQPGTGSSYGLIFKILFIIAMFILVIGFGRWILPWTLNYLAQKNNREGFLLVVLLAVFLAAWAMHQAGVSMALGAFLMGMLLSGSRYRMQVQAVIEPYKGLFMSLFFVAVGMSIHFATLAAQPLLFMQHIFVLFGLKILVLLGLLLAFGYSRAVAVKVSFLLAQGGEFGFVLFGAAKVAKLISDETFMLALGLISVTMLLTPLLVKIGEIIALRADKQEHDNTDILASAFGLESAENKVIVGGYGRVGHTVVTMLHSSGVPVLAFDTNPKRVAQGREDGFHVYFGNIGDLELLNAAHVEQASLVVLTINDRNSTLEAVSHLRGLYTHIPIICRAHDLQDCAALYEAGATHAYPEAVESSMKLGSIALEMVNVPQTSVEMLMQDVRSDNYQLVEEPNLSIQQTKVNEST